MEVVNPDRVRWAYSYTSFLPNADERAVDATCEVILNQVCILEEVPFYDPGINHLWIRTFEDNSRSLCISRELAARMKAVGMRLRNYPFSIRNMKEQLK